MRYLLAILILCATVSHGAEPGTYTPTIAAAAGFSTVAKPAPLPTPDPGNICPDCNGKGWNGDGTHRFKCEPCNGTGKRTTTATVEQLGAPVSSMREQVAEVNESPTPEVDKKSPLPAVFTDYTTAALEATSSRELLVVLHPGYSLEKQADLQRRMGETKAAHRYVWLILDATAMVKQQKAQDYFGAERPSAVVIHNPVTGENRQVTKLADLEN